MVNRHKLGLLLGTFLGPWHFAWAWLVLSGMAQSLMNWICDIIHFLFLNKWGKVIYQSE